MKINIKDGDKMKVFNKEKYLSVMDEIAISKTTEPKL